MDDKVVAARSQVFQKPPFGLGLHQRTEFLPLAVDCMQLADRRMQRQHFGGIGINKRIDFDVRRVCFQDRKDGGAEQYVAVVPELDDERPTNFAERNGIFNHGGILPVHFMRRRRFRAGTGFPQSRMLVFLSICERVPRVVNETVKRCYHFKKRGIGHCRLPG